jgi:hypothetical protein
MLVAKRIHNLIIAHGEPICDGCIAEALHLTAHAHTAQITAALGTTPDFSQERGKCSVCKNERAVVQATRTVLIPRPGRPN